MILTAHQPAYLAWLGYFHKIALADKFVLLDDVQFEKNSFTNRNKIKTPNETTWLTIPVKISGHTSKTIKDIEIDEKSNWNKKHWQSILMNYKKSAYFTIYADFFESMYTNPSNQFSDFVQISFLFFLKELDITTTIIKQSDLKTQATKQDLIVELCRLTDCTTFVFGALGKNYADENYFQENQITIYFQEYKHPTYNQLWGNFISHLSILDLLFNLGKERSSEIIFENNISKKELQLLLNQL